MPAKRRYVGWRVLWMTLADRIDRPFCRASSEWWNTDSFLNCDGGDRESQAAEPDQAAVPAV